MNREDLIEEAAKAMAERAPRQTWEDCDQAWYLAHARVAFAVFEKPQAPTTNYIDIVFDGPPEAEAGRFVEVEDATGASVKFGEWVEREDGYWVLRIEASAQASTDEEQHWSDAAASAYPGDECDNADLRTAFGRGVKWERRRPAQTEPTAIQFAARRIGKSQALIDSMLAQANEHGIRVEVVYPQGEPTDAQVRAALTEWYRGIFGAGRPGEHKVRMRATLIAAFTAGQEDKP